MCRVTETVTGADMPAIVGAGDASSEPTATGSATQCSAALRGGCEGGERDPARGGRGRRGRGSREYVPDPRRWRILAVSLLVGFMSLLDVTIVNVAVPSIRAGLEASTSDGAVGGVRAMRWPSA